jgi:hypothetical protein
MEMETWRWRHGDGDMETRKYRHGEMEAWRNGDIETWRQRQRHEYIKWKTGALAIIINPFTVCSTCKQKLIVFPFVDEETNRSYPFANGLNRLNGLAHLRH